MLDDRVLVVPVAAQQPVDLAQALLEPRERRRVVVDGSAEARDPGGHVLDLRLEAREPVGEPAPRPSSRASDAISRSARADLLARPPPLAEQRLADLGGARGDRLAVLGRRELARDVRGLARPQARRVDLARLVLQDVEPAKELARVHRQLRERGAVRPPPLHGRRDRRPGLAVAAVGVEQVALPALVEQPLLVVLPVDLDQAPVARASRPAVTASSSTRAVERPFAPTSRTAIRGSGSRSNSASTRALSAPCRTSVASARAPKREPQGIDQQALAGPGLAGEHVEARRERQSQAVDQREVVDGELEQAAGAPGRGLGGSRGARSSLRHRHRAPPSRGQQLDLRPQQVPERHAAGRLDEPDRPLERPHLDHVADLDPVVLAAVDRDQRLVRRRGSCSARPGAATRRSSGSPTGSRRSG